jgi:hypothetical protein
MTREDKMKLWQERLQHQKDSQLSIAAWCELQPNCPVTVLLLAEKAHNIIHRARERHCSRVNVFIADDVGGRNPRRLPSLRP